MAEFVRAADPEDIAALVGLEDEIRDILAGTERGGSQWLEQHPRLGPTGWQVRLADPGWTTLVGGIDAVVLAFASMRRPVGRSRPVAEVECIYVTEEARGMSLGEDLLSSLVEQATADGAREIDATALPGDRDTKNLFERFGLVARLIVVSRRLDR